MDIIQRLTDLNAQLVRGGDYHPELDKEAKEWVYNRIQRFIEEQML